MKNIIDVSEILVPIIVVFLSFGLKRVDTKTLTKQKYYKYNILEELFKKLFVISLFIITLFVSFLLNYLCYNFLIKFIKPEITIYILIFINIIINELITKLHKKKINKNIGKFIYLFNELKHGRVKSLLNIVLVSWFILVGLEYLSGKNINANNVAGYTYIISGIFMISLSLLTKVKFFSNIIIIHDIKVNFKNGSYIKCNEIYEKRKHYILKNNWRDYRSERSNTIEVKKDDVNSISISSRYIDLQKIYKKNLRSRAIANNSFKDN